MIYSAEIKAAAVQLCREGLDYIDIAIKLGPSATSVRAWARAAGVPRRSTRHVVPYFDDATKALARRMKASGSSYREIMAATGASHHAVWRWTRRDG